MKNIALSFSGGGFRAAAFSLGTLSYLNKVHFAGEPLLQKVKYISSTSGGSITNLMYSAGICAGESFAKIYRKIFNSLEGELLIKKVFEILQDDQKWKDRNEKSRNLINAFSIAYDELLFDKEQFQIFTDCLHDKHLREICVTSTEFANGISFRFQSQSGNEGYPKGKVGNAYVYFNRETKVAGRLKLADILAASSCFPGGFEPFIFPNDFTHEALTTQELSSQITIKTNPFSQPRDKVAGEKKVKRFGLMDGGVADNQAIDSVLLANSRRKNNKLPSFDLILVTDVASYFMDPYKVQLEKKSWLSQFSLLSVLNGLKLTGLMFPALLVFSAFFGWHTWMFLLVIPTLLALSLYFVIKKTVGGWKRDAEDDKSTWGVVMFKYLMYFLRLRVSALVQMLFARINSLLILTNDVYLKQVRRQYYERLYEDEMLSRLVVSNAIYDLSEVKQKAKADSIMQTVTGFDTINEPEDVEIPPPSAALVSVAEKARLMPTTLWFDRFQATANVRAAIIATGQFTTCYNLLKHLIKLEESAPMEPCLAELKAALLEDWNGFNEAPYRLYNVEGQNFEDFTPINLDYEHATVSTTGLSEA